MKKLKIPPIPKGHSKKPGPRALDDANKVSQKAAGKLKTLMKKPAFAKGGKVSKVFHRLKDYASKADGRAKLDARFENGLINPREYERMLSELEKSDLPDPATRMKLNSFAKGGAIRDLSGQLEQLRQRVKTMPPGKERDALVDQYSGQRRELGNRVSGPVKPRYADGGKATAVQRLTKLIGNFKPKAATAPTITSGAPPGGAGGIDPKQVKIQRLVQQFQRVSQEFEKPNLDPMTEQRLDHAAGQILEQLGQLGYDTTQLTGQ